MARKQTHTAFVTLTVKLFIEAPAELEYESDDGETKAVPVNLTKEQRRELFNRAVAHLDEKIGELSESEEIRVGVSDADPQIHGDRSVVLSEDVWLHAKFYGQSDPEENPARGGKPKRSARGKAAAKPRGTRKAAAHAQPMELTYRGRDGQLYAHPFGKGAQLVGIPGGGVAIKGVRVVRGQIVG